MAFVDISFAKSSNISRVQHDADTQTLRVTFHQKGAPTEQTYDYDGVSEDVAYGFQSAPSAGQYLHNNIKGQFQHTKS